LADWENTAALPINFAAANNMRGFTTYLLERRKQNIHRILRKKGGGFTLIELIIYIGIVTMILLTAFNFGWEIIYGNIKAQTIREVQQNARFSMERIVRALQAGEAVAIFSVLNDTLYQNGIALTTDRIKVTNFQIISISNTYKVNLTLEYDNPQNRREYEASLDLETAVSPGQ